MVVSLFCTPENGILIQDSFPLNEEYECLLGIEVPYHYFVRKVSSTIHFNLNTYSGYLHYQPNKWNALFCSLFDSTVFFLVFF